MTLRLPRCAACGAFHYPPREICPVCHALPDGPMKTEIADDGGEVLAVAVLHASLEKAFEGRLPLAIATVALTAGPVVLAVNEGRAAPGDQVAVSWQDGPAGGSFAAEPSPKSLAFGGRDPSQTAKD